MKGITMLRTRTRLAAWLLLAVCSPAFSQDQGAGLATQLAGLDADVLPRSTTPIDADAMLPRFLRGQIHGALAREAEAFAALKTRADWEKYRDLRLEALRRSLGAFETAKNPRVTVTRTIDAAGYQIRNLVFESRPGLLVTANLYMPAKPPAAMPGILIIHGFHQPKSQGELQDMGVNWARLGCAVLVPDQLCHGERRQHPFVDAQSYAGTFNLPRQDYYSRANAGLQLQLVGDSLMGWMVWDAMRCMDVLLAQAGVDKEKIIVLGAVAAGGDTAAVAAALDPRIRAVVPFNFGGPEPETAYPLPDAAEKVFPYGSGGHWDSTRRLRHAARDGFFPWTIVGAVAPRRVIYAHEFAWDHEHDPVWPRLKSIYQWYDAADRLAVAHGSGTLFGKPEGTGCANIGAVHRRAMYPVLQRWFGMTPPENEVQERRPADDLRCLTRDHRGNSVQEITAARAKEQLQNWRSARLTVDQRRDRLRADWGKLLGVRQPDAGRPARVVGEKKLGTITVCYLTQETEPGIVVPIVLLVPRHREGEKCACVVGLAQDGKPGFLKHRASTIAELLQEGVAVCLPDLRGTGETRSRGDRRGPAAGRLVAVQETSAGTVLASEAQMLGRTLLGDRLHDLRAVLQSLRGHRLIDPGRIALWGDSFRPALARGPVNVPWDAEALPPSSEPLGGLLALFAALFDDDIRAVSVQGSLVGYQQLLSSQFCFTPPDVIVPGALTAGDLADVAAALAPRPLAIARAVDGVNRPVDAAALHEQFQAVRQAYAAAPARLRLAGHEASDGTAAWLAAHLKPR